MESPLRRLEGYVGAEGDHAYAGGYALATAEAGTGFELALKGCCEEHDQQVSARIQDHGDGAQGYELKENVAAFGGDELRDEGEEEQRGLGIQRLREDPLAKCALRRRRRKGHLGVAGANHADAEPYEVSGTGILHGVKGHGGSSENRGHAKRRGEDVKESADEGAQRGMNAFAAAAREGARQHVENAGTGRDGEKQCGGEEQRKTMRIDHAPILPFLRADRFKAKALGP